MKLFRFTGVLCLAAAAFAQSTHFDHDRSADFAAFKTYQWVDSPSGGAPSQLMDQNIKRAVDSQLASKGMQRVENGADVQISYQAAIDEEKQIDAWGAGPRFWGAGRVTTSTIQVGKLVINIIDPARKQLVWRGEAEKTRHQEGSGQELREPSEGDGQVIQELPAIQPQLERPMLVTPVLRPGRDARSFVSDYRIERPSP